MAARPRSRKDKKRAMKRRVFVGARARAENGHEQGRPLQFRVTLACPGASCLRDQSDCVRRNREAPANVADAFIRGSFKADVAHGKMRRFRERSFHLCDVGMELWLLSDD